MTGDSDKLSKWESETSFEVDVEAQSPENKIRFADGANQRERQSRPTLTRILSTSSFESTLSKRKVEPSILLPPLFKSVSYKIDDDNISAFTLADKKAQDFKSKEWHSKSLEHIAQELGTSLQHGLTTEKFNANLKVFGANVPSPPPSNLLRKVFFYLFGGFGSLLLIAGILCIVAWKPLGNPNPATANLVLGVVLFMVFVLQALFNFWQDFSSSQVMNSINSMLPSDVQVVRNGVKSVETARNLVPGDLIFIQNGDKLSADVRFVAVGGGDFSFDRSILTGESKPIYASAETDKRNSNYLESSSIGLQGTFCVGGSGYGVVVSTGDDTVFGQLAKLSSVPKNGSSPLQKEIMKFVIIVVSIVLFFVVLVCILWGAWQRKSYPGRITTSGLIINLVSVSVAFIPEGLPIALTTCLIITAAAMKRNKILCKSLAVVETLGSVSTLCSDKTGTLTKNQMFVTEFCVGEQESKSEDIHPNVGPGVQRLGLISRLCNSSSFDPTTLHKPVNERLMNGSNATDKAILRLGEAIITETNTSIDNWSQKVEISFNSKNKFMIRLFQEEGQADYTLMIKGAPDILISRCESILNDNGNVEKLSFETLKKIEKIQEKWSISGQRVVLIASRSVPASEFENVEFKSKLCMDKLLYLAERDLTLNGLVGITDPPKDDIFDVVSVLKNAGIKVCMVTGDFETTAVAIAIQCGILSPSVNHSNIKKFKDLEDDYPIPEKPVKLYQRGVVAESISLTGSDIEKMNDNQWETLVDYKEIVFSRTTPEQKLKIVENFQKRGHVVAMTGDGVNDAPSLKQADVGIAMAEGSEIAKEASDLVLLDSFSSMVMALKYGRLVFENLRKTIAYLIPAGCYAELWAIILNIMFGFPQILSSFCMIIICCLTDCAGAITLAYEAPEKNLLMKKPRSVSGEPLVDWKLFLHSYITIGTYLTFVACMMSFIYFKEHDIPFEVLSLSYGVYPDGYDADTINTINEGASSVYFVTLVILQFFNLMSVRTRSLSLFQQKPLFNKETQNIGLFIAIIFALAVTFFFNYIPWFQDNLGTSAIHVKYYFIAAAFGVLLLVYDELRKLFVRKYPESFLAKMAW